MGSRYRARGATLPRSTSPDLCAQDHQPLRVSHAEFRVRNLQAPIATYERKGLKRCCRNPRHVDSTVWSFRCLHAPTCARAERWSPRASGGAVGRRAVAIGAAVERQSDSHRYDVKNGRNGTVVRTQLAPPPLGVRCYPIPAWGSKQQHPQRQQEMFPAISLFVLVVKVGFPRPRF